MPAPTTGFDMIPGDIQKGLQDAQILADQGKIDAAIYILQQLHKAHPENYAVLVKLGEFAINVKNYAYAIEVLRKASLLRPKDIAVRLTLIDIYQTYKMPVQEYVIIHEILALAPHHSTALNRLADFYQKQGISGDEIEIRQQIKRLSPDDYKNLKRLADIFDDNDELWEAARVYEQIRVYHPKRLNDMRRLAAIYDKLGENFRQLQVLDHIADHGGHRGWMQKRANKRLRLQNEVFDSFQASSTFRKHQMDELDIDAVLSEATYMHIPVRSSIDLGLHITHARFQHTGKGTLDGSMNINSGALAFQGVKYWQGQDYQLGANVGILWDDVAGRLYPRDPLSGIDEDDFPFLRDPTFSSYGGAMAIGGVQFLAQPGYRSSYEVAYEHGQIDELDARLRMFYFDKFLFGATYETDDETTFHFQVDESAFSDGNSRSHGSASAFYTLWGKSPMYDYRGKRQGFIRRPPYPFLRAGYQMDYFSDQDVSNVYWSYDDEIQHQGRVSSQMRIYQQGLNQNIILGLHLAYTAGDALDYREEAGLSVFYLNSETENEIGLSYAFEKERVDAISRNLRIIGDSEMSMITLYGKWRF